MLCIQLKIIQLDYFLPRYANITLDERRTFPRQLSGKGFMDLYKQLEEQISRLCSYFQIKAKRILQRATIGTVDSTQLQLNDVFRYHRPMKNAIRWKQLHERHEVARDHVDNTLSTLTSENIFPERESFLLSVQDQIKQLERTYSTSLEC